MSRRARKVGVGDIVARGTDTGSNDPLSIGMIERVIDVPDGLVRTVTRTWDDAGRDWLDGLEALLAGLATDWGLRLGDPYALSYHWVAPVTCDDGTAAVLKVGVPDGHLDAEATALRAFDGHGCVRLLRADPARGALLLERAEPGDTAELLAPDDDERATAVLADLLAQLHTAPVPPEGLPHVRDELDEFAVHLARFPGDDPIPRRTVERAAALWQELCDSSPGDVVLHGDLHHANVLAATRSPGGSTRPGASWLAIDPHGRVGDPGYDTGQLLYNPARAGAALPDLAPARVEQLADELGMPIERVRAWGFAVCVLSEVWSAGDGPVDGTPLAVAQRLEAEL